MNVRYWGNSGMHMLTVSSSQFDPVLTSPARRNPSQCSVCSCKKLTNISHGSGTKLVELIASVTRMSSPHGIKSPDLGRFGFLLSDVDRDPTPENWDSLIQDIELAAVSNGKRASPS